MTWKPSPNFTAPLNGPWPVNLVVLHATATPTLASPLAWLCDPASKVSAHYLIDTNGDVYQLVDEANVAWHAGASAWKGQAYHNSVNAYSIGIELVHPNDGKTPYDPRQLDATARLCAKIAAHRGFTTKSFVSHADVAIPHGRKDDPRAFPWSMFCDMLRQLGVPE